MCKWALALPLVALPWLMTSCSADSGQGRDLAVDVGVYELSAPDQAVADTKAPPDLGVDQAQHDATTVDQGSGGLKLGPSHTGYQQTSCTPCHKLPPFQQPDAGTTGDLGVKPSMHATFTQSWECAMCHGGNGACAPNAPASLKTDHTNQDACGTCHGQKHGYTPPAPCLGCHFVGGPTVTNGKVACP